jgi:anti-sigma regulatory factor (Ser/Thr protein kinase)
MGDEHMWAEQRSNWKVERHDGVQARVWEWVSTYGPAVTGLCRASGSLLPGVGGVGLSTGPVGTVQEVRFASDDISSLIEFSQSTMAEGPGRDAADTGQVVVADDLALGYWRQRWPSFTPAALTAGVRAVVALPLHAGGVRHKGVVHLYRRSPRGLDERSRARALTFAGAVAELLTLESLDLDMTDAFDGLRHAGLDRVRAAPNLDGVPGSGGSAVLLARWFDLATLVGTRREVRAAGAGQGLAGDDLYQFVLGVHEAMTNAVRHGGGRGQLLLWRSTADVWCEVADHGPGLPEARLPVHPPGPKRPDHRGLWLIRRACTSCKVTSDPTGTRILLSYRLDHRSAGHGDQ